MHGTTRNLGREEIHFLLPGDERRNYGRIMIMMLRKMLQFALVHELDSGILCTYITIGLARFFL
jgi:hypothetical protein